MENLIKVQSHNGQSVISAREIHGFLGVQTDFTDWCKRMFEYGFEENKDYSLLKIGERNAHNKVDYLLTLDTAKEIGMIQKTAKGREIRNYFILCEKALYQVATIAERKALNSQSELCRLKTRKRELEASIQPELREIRQITREMGKLQNATFEQLGLFEPTEKTEPINNII
ncbi:MAG: antA/AntB antirepressor family protein [Spirosomataceae bacterium]